MMKRPYHHNIKTGKTGLLIGGGLFAALFLVFFLLEALPPVFNRQPFLYISRPVLVLRVKVLDWGGIFFGFFKNKEDLIRENKDLRARLIELENSEIMVESLRQENEEMKDIFSRSGGMSFILTSIISGAGYGNYNTVIVDAGSGSGVLNGMQATVFGDFLMGYVSETVSNSAVIKPVSFPGFETNVFIGNRVSAIAKGRGGGNMEIILPNGIEVGVGEPVFTLGTKPLVLGIVEKIIKEPADPFQKILLRTPFNINELKRVYIIK